MQQITLIIDHIRHAYSCANTIKTLAEKSKLTSVINIAKNIASTGLIENDRGIITPDSLISDLGVDQSKELGINLKERLAKADMILCSELKRTMETGLIAYHEVYKVNNKSLSKIHVIPFVGETEEMGDNIPLEENKTFIKETLSNATDKLQAWISINNRTKTKEFMSNKYPTNEYLDIDFEYWKDIRKKKFDLNQMDNIQKSLPTYRSNNKDFYQYVVPHITKKLVSEHTDFPSEHVFYVTLFTHSGHITSHFGFNDQSKDGKLNMSKNKNKNQYVDALTNKPRNTNIYTEKFVLNISDINNIKILSSEICEDSGYPQLTLDQQNVKTNADKTKVTLDHVQKCIKDHGQSNYFKYLCKINEGSPTLLTKQKELCTDPYNHAKEEYKKNKLAYKELVTKYFSN